MKLKSTLAVLATVILIFSFQDSKSQSTGIYFQKDSAAGAFAYFAGTQIFWGNADDSLKKFSSVLSTGTWRFEYGGIVYSDVYVSTNGFVSFVQPPGANAVAQSLPNTNSLSSNPYGILAPLWDDLKISPTGCARVQVTAGGGSAITIE